MTNFEYIVRNLKGTDLALFLTRDYECKRTEEEDNCSILYRANNAFWATSLGEEGTTCNRPMNVLFQLWLARQYNSEEWIEEKK